MLQSFPGVNPSISEWKGQEIVDFQEDLREKVNAYISEKWFYNHMKSSHPTLPRIDMLNLLSRYAGYTNWDDFKYKHGNQSKYKGSLRKANRFFILIPLLVILIMSIFYGFYKLLNTCEYHFCFYDADTREPILNNIIEVTLLRKDESPITYLCKQDGCLALKTGETCVHLVVKAPYYHTDTIIRILDKFNRDETVTLHANNYALMIHYFSRMSVKDWQKRRNQLDRMISDSAVIYQVFDQPAVGMELYNKWEFINLITMPSTTLKQLEVLDTKYTGDRISLLRFRQKNKTQ